jgi:hypothetical protein
MQKAEGRILVVSGKWLAVSAEGRKQFVRRTTISIENNIIAENKARRACIK